MSSALSNLPAERASPLRLRAEAKGRKEESALSSLPSPAPWTDLCFPAVHRKGLREQALPRRNIDFQMSNRSETTTSAPTFFWQPAYPRRYPNCSTVENPGHQDRQTPEAAQECSRPPRLQTTFESKYLPCYVLSSMKYPLIYTHHLRKNSRRKTWSCGGPIAVFSCSEQCTEPSDRHK